MDNILFKMTFGLMGSPSGQVFLQPLEAKLEDIGSNIVGSAWASLIIALFDIFGLLFRSIKIGYRLNNDQLESISRQQFKIMQVITEFSEFYHDLLPESPQDRDEVSAARLEAAMLDYLITHYGADWEHGIKDQLQVSPALHLLSDQINDYHDAHCLDCAKMPDDPMAALAQILGIDLEELFEDDLDLDKIESFESIGDYI